MPQHGSGSSNDAAHRHNRAHPLTQWANFDDVSGLRGLYQEVIAKIHSNMARGFRRSIGAGDEEQVARLELTGVVDRASHVDLVEGGPREPYADVEVGALDEAGAVPSVGAGSAVNVGLAELGEGEGDDGDDGS